uniref:Polysaccharide deacetylase n=1 Tax=Haliea sp. ETY-M TaxID=1055105 RepID=A0A455R531_9GAMM|nr:polysaccharide deacetylase [Haliea sp. ETY-M]
MSLPDEYMQYPHRSYGMDHDRYDWSLLGDRKPVQWPDVYRLAVWINVSLQFFPLNQEGKPFPPPGGMTMPYPDLRHFTLRDYGNRVGIYRVLEALDRYGLRATFAVNGQVAERAAPLLRTITERGDEVLGHGWNMDSPHYGGLDERVEQSLVTRTLETLRDATGQPVRGWLSPGRNESERTPELLVDNGIDYFCDWVNDDMPYPFRTDSGPLTALPLSTELEDRFVVMNNLHSEQSWCEQVCDACDMLLRESDTQGGRLLAISLHPWLIGQPHRIGKLETALEYISSRAGIWNASAADIVDAWRDQQEPDA